ncbi:MAG TPA: glycosyltransferase family 39 protein [Chloroflexota bacterium]|nr:glycosyltransferase family 39 protein [Chloroflexota bacterium]
MGSRRSGRRWDAWLLPALLVVGAYLRLANLADNPGWDGDEGYNLNIAANLLAGHARMFAMRYVFVQHPPFFYLLGALVMKLWTPDLIALRALSACCGVLTILALQGLGSALGGRRLGWAAALFYAIWPEAVLQVRWAYTYNLLALLVLLTLWAALSPYLGRLEGLVGDSTPPRRWRNGAIGPALLAGFLAGLALATDQEAAILVPALVYLWWGRDWKPLAGGVLAMAAPPCAYLGVMLATRKDDVLFDIHHTASRLDSGPGDILARLTDLFRFDPLVVLGLCGLALVAHGRPRKVIVGLAIGLTGLVLEVRDPAPVFRAAEPLLPLAGLGMGALVLALMDLIGRMVGGNGRRGARAALAALVLLVPLGGTLVLTDLGSIRGGFATGLKPTLPRSAAEARRMAAWVNARVRPTDLVIAMPGISWLFHCRATELLQAVAVSGHGAAFYPDGLSMARFAYDPRLDTARFLVVDDFTRLWIAEQPRERALVRRAEQQWSIVYQRGEYVVYAHPK